MLEDMADRSRQAPNLTERGKNEAAQRQERLAAALRDNLRKRKQQARGREELLREERASRDEK